MDSSTNILENSSSHKLNFDNLFVYLLINSSDWEDIVVFLSEKEAIEASIKYPNSRVELFYKTPSFGYSPTYNYYKNGIFFQTSFS